MSSRCSHTVDVRRAFWTCVLIRVQLLDGGDVAKACHGEGGTPPVKSETSSCELWWRVPFDMWHLVCGVWCLPCDVSHEMWHEMIHVWLCCVTYDVWRATCNLTYDIWRDVWYVLCGACRCGGGRQWNRQALVLQTLGVVHTKVDVLAIPRPPAATLHPIGWRQPNLLSQRRHAGRIPLSSGRGRLHGNGRQLQSHCVGSTALHAPWCRCGGRLDHRGGVLIFAATGALWKAELRGKAGWGGPGAGHLHLFPDVSRNPGMCPQEVCQLSWGYIRHPGWQKTWQSFRAEVGATTTPWQATLNRRASIAWFIWAHFSLSTLASWSRTWNSFEISRSLKQLWNTSSASLYSNQSKRANDKKKKLVYFYV